MAKDLIEVRMLTSFGSPDPENDLEVGQTYKLAKDFAERLLEREYAELVEPARRRKPQETATRQRRERAARPPAERR